MTGVQTCALPILGLAISLGSIYSLDNKPSINYKSGAQIVLQVSNISNPDNINIIGRQTEKRLKLSLSPSSDYKVVVNSDNYLTITGTNINTDERLLKFQNFVAPKYVFKPIITTTKSPNSILDNIEFTDATLSGDSISVNLAKSIPELSDDSILIWKDFEGLRNLASTKFNDEWTSSEINKDPYKFLYINGITKDVEGGQKAILKTKDFGGFNAIDYLISKNSASNGFTTSINLDFSFAPKITKKQIEKIFYNLDFSVSNYKFNSPISNFINPTGGSNTIWNLIIATVVAFSFTSIFLIVNYGLLGALSTICVAFLVFLGLLMITIFRGDYTPESIVAIMVSIAIGLDLNIAFFERIKKELKSGIGLQKSLKKADKLTFGSSIIKGSALIITSIVIYVIGSLYLGTFSSLVLILSILNVLIMFILIRVLTNLIIGTKVFNKKLKWVGIYKEINEQPQDKNTFINELEAKPTQEFKNSTFLKDNNILSIATSGDKKVSIVKKLALLVLSVISVIGTILFTTFSLLGSSWLSGFNASGSITSPTVLLVNNVEETNVDDVKSYLVSELGISKKEVKSLVCNNEKKTFSIEVITKKTLDNYRITQINNSLTENYNTSLINYSLIAGTANLAILNIIYVALTVILVMFMFVLVKSDWTYALSMFIALIISFLLFILLFTFQIFSFNTLFIFALSSAILIAVSNNITILFRIKEKFKNKKTEELIMSDIKKISDIAVKESIRRLLISNGLLMVMMLIFSILPGVLSISLTIPIMIFIFISLVISTVILPFFFNIFKAFKCKRRRDKIINNYWHTQIVEEQIFPNINDII